MSIQMILPDFLKHIFLPALAAGRLPSAPPDGKTRRKSGPVHAHVSRSLPQVKAKASKTPVTYGQILIDSSALDVPLSFLESRLLDRLAMHGSMEYVRTLKVKTTTAGRSIFRLAASALPISGIDCGGSLSVAGYPSPNNRQNGGGDYSDPERAAARLDSGHQINLSEIALVSGWTSPQAHDAATPNADRVGRYGTIHGGANLNDEAALVSQTEGYPTPTVPNGGRRPKGGSMSMAGMTPGGEKRQVDLDFIARSVQGWASPSARDWKDTPGMATEAVNPDGSLRDRTDQLGRQVSGWTTARASDGEKGGPNMRFGAGGEPLPRQAALTGWPSPTKEEGHAVGDVEMTAIAKWKDGEVPSTTFQRLRTHAHLLTTGTPTPSSDQTPKEGTDEPDSPGQALAPQFTCWLMGYPESHLHSSPGFNSLALVRSLLDGLPVSPDLIEMALSEATETP